MVQNDKNIPSFKDAEKIRQELNKLLANNTTIQEINKEKTNSNNSDTSKGMAASMSIFSSVIVGGFLGYGFDYLFNTLPFATVIMIPIGMIAGFVTMIRMLNQDKSELNTEKSE